MAGKKTVKKKAAKAEAPIDVKLELDRVWAEFDKHQSLVRSIVARMSDVNKKLEKLLDRQGLKGVV